MTSRHPDEAGDFTRGLAGELPDGWEAHLPAFTPADGEMATRDAGGEVLAALAAVVTEPGRRLSRPRPVHAHRDQGWRRLPEPAAATATTTVRRHREAPAASGATRAATSTSACASTPWPRR